jgi:hypothetical protein
VQQGGENGFSLEGLGVSFYEREAPQLTEGRAQHNKL